MVEGMIAGLDEAASMCEMAAGVHRRKGELEAAAALDGMALSLHLRASEEQTPADDGGMEDLRDLQTRGQRLWAWIRSL